MSSHCQPLPQAKLEFLGCSRDNLWVTFAVVPIEVITSVLERKKASLWDLLSDVRDVETLGNEIALFQANVWNSQRYQPGRTAYCSTFGKEETNRRRHCQYSHGQGGSWTVQDQSSYQDWTKALHAPHAAPAILAHHSLDHPKLDCSSRPLEISKRSDKVLHHFLIYLSNAKTPVWIKDW